MRLLLDAMAVELEMDKTQPLPYSITIQQQEFQSCHFPFDLELRESRFTQLGRHLLWQFVFYYSRREGASTAIISRQKKGISTPTSTLLNPISTPTRRWGRSKVDVPCHLGVDCLPELPIDLPHLHFRFYAFSG